MSNTSSLTDELTGKTGIQTDHGGLDIGDLIVLLSRRGAADLHRLAQL